MARLPRDMKHTASADLASIYVDVLKKGYKIRAYWVGDMVCVTTEKDLGMMQLHGHTVYIKGTEELTEEKYGKG